MRDKTKRLRGSQTHGRGWRSSKHKGGSRGGVGRAGTKTHKRFSRILEAKAQEKNRKVTNIRDLESKLDRYLKKKYLVLKNKVISPTEKFYKKYSKILSTGEASYKYEIDRRRIKLSKVASLKLLK